MHQSTKMDPRRRKAKRQQDKEEEPNKDEYAVANFLRFNLPVKEAKLRGMPVVSFAGMRAVDMLMDSKWATNRGKSQALFNTRASCVEYCNRLLSKGLFHRAARLEKKREKTSQKRESKEEDEEKKRKKRLRLEMHDQQLFIDGEDIYVWIYDPTPFKNKVIGLLLVLGAVCVCLFPLWPPEVRLGVYYVSLAAAAFVAFILGLCIVRHIVFSFIWAVTFGKHHLWLLPNLTEDVGFLESFKPIYKYETYTKTEMKDDTEVESDTIKSKERKETEELDSSTIIVNTCLNGQKSCEAEQDDLFERT